VEESSQPKLAAPSLGAPLHWKMKTGGGKTLRKQKKEEKNITLIPTNLKARSLHKKGSPAYKKEQGVVQSCRNPCHGGAVSRSRK